MIRLRNQSRSFTDIFIREAKIIETLRSADVRNLNFKNYVTVFVSTMKTLRKVNVGATNLTTWLPYDRSSVGYAAREELLEMENVTTGAIMISESLRMFGTLLQVPLRGYSNANSVASSGTHAKSLPSSEADTLKPLAASCRRKRKWTQG